MQARLRAKNHTGEADRMDAVAESGRREEENKAETRQRLRNEETRQRREETREELAGGNSSEGDKQLADMRVESP